MEKRRLLLEESKQEVMCWWEREIKEERRWEGIAERNETAAAETSGSGKSRSVLMPLTTESHRSGVSRGVERIKSNASFLQTAEAGEETISSTAVLAITEVSLPAADCCKACKRAPD